MRTVTVTGAAGHVGRALLTRLDTDRGVGRIIGVDTTEPEMPVAKLDFRRMDVRDPLLGQAFAGTDVVVHCVSAAAGQGLTEDEMFAVNVGGTRNALAAAAAAGVANLVYLSHAMVYGAHPDNACPLDEASSLRANPDFPPAYQRLLAEELVAAWAKDHPQVTVCVLRPAITMGSGGEDPTFAALFDLPRIPLVRGLRPPWQFVHGDDVAAALHLAAVDGLAGAYNVAADGWLSTDEMCALLGRRPVEVGEAVAFETTARLWRLGLSPVPPGALHYCAYPWVVATERLHHAGWSPTRTNRDILREYAADHYPYLNLGPVRVRRRTLYGLAGLSGAGFVAGAVALARRLRRG